MVRKMLPVFAALLGLGMMAPAALAADLEASDSAHDGIKVWKPYVVEKNCADGFNHCTVPMDYAPPERAMVVRPGSYWYQKPFKVYRYGDFKHHHKHRHAYRHGVSAHVAWCSGRYRSYDPATDTFLGKGHTRHACNSPYDGR